MKVIEYRQKGHEDEKPVFVLVENNPEAYQLDQVDIEKIGAVLAPSGEEFIGEIKEKEKHPFMEGHGLIENVIEHLKEKKNEIKAILDLDCIAIKELPAADLYKDMKKLHKVDRYIRAGIISSAQKGHFLIVERCMKLHDHVTKKLKEFHKCLYEKIAPKSSEEEKEKATDDSSEVEEEF